MNEFLRWFVAINDTWIHHYNPKSNQQSAKWMLLGESRPKCPKTQQSIGSFSQSFLIPYGIIFTDYLEHGKTINMQYSEWTSRSKVRQIVRPKAFQSMQYLLFVAETIRFLRNKKCSKYLHTQVWTCVLSVEWTLGTLLMSTYICMGHLHSIWTAEYTTLCYFWLKYFISISFLHPV